MHAETCLPPACRRAVRLLRRLADEALASGRPRLPTIADLRLRWRLSTVTLCRAVRVLREEGLLDARPRAGLRVQALRPMPAPVVPDHAKLRRWQEVKHRISADIAASVFTRASQLPTRKEMRHRYGAANLTLRRALAALAGEGRIVRRGRSYAVREPAVARSSAAVTVLSMASSMEALLSMGPRSAEMWRALERECFRRGLRLSALPLAAWSAAAGREAGNPAGVLVLTVGLAQDRFEEILRRTAAAQVPVAVIDELRQLRVPAAHAGRPSLLFVNSAEGESAGRAMAAHLLGQGHRRVTVFGHDSQSPWPSDRIRGLRALYQQAGSGFGVTVESIDTFVRTFLSVTGARPASRMHASFMRHLAAAQSAAEAAPSNGLKLHGLAWGFLFDQLLAREFAPLFERALSDGGASAWVGVSDAVALAALDFLARRGVRVPEQLAVAGFDDTLEALGAELTSYNFNVEASVAAALDHLLAPGRLRRGRGAQAVAVPGMVMTRRSTARLRA